MKEEMRTIGYLCPACHKRVIQQRSVFALRREAAHRRGDGRGP